MRTEFTATALEKLRNFAMNKSVTFPVFIVMRNGHIMPPGLFTQRSNAEEVAAKEDGQVVELYKLPYYDARYDLLRYDLKHDLCAGSIEGAINSLECGHIGKCRHCRGLDFCMKSQALKELTHARKLIAEPADRLSAVVEEVRGTK